MKLCSKCKIEKEFECFGKSKCTKDGYRYECKSCRKIYNIQNKNKIREYKKKYYQLNKEKCNKISKKWYIENIDFKKEYDKKYHLENKEKRKKTYDEWRVNNIDRLRDYKKQYYHNVVVNDPDKKIRISTRSIVKRFLKSKSKKTSDIIGCSYEYLREYLESKFEDWMNWENYGKYNGELEYGWDIDHIIPLSFAKSDSEVMELNHYTNLQPLCSKINRDIKKDKIDFKYIDNEIS